MSSLGGFGMYSSGGGGGSAIPSEDMSYGVASGTNTYTVTLSPAITEYTTGLFINVKFTNANTSSSPTLNCNSLGAKNILSIDSSSVYGGQIDGSSIYSLLYDGTNFILLNSISWDDLRIVARTTTDQTIITGVTSNQITYSVEIPPNTFKTGDSPEIFFRNVFTGTAGNKTNRVYINTSNSLSGANIIATASSPSTALTADVSRIFNIKSSTVTQVYTPTTSNFSSQSSSTVALAEYNIDWTSSQWIIVAIQLGRGADAGVLSYFKLTN